MRISERDENKYKSQYGSYTQANSQVAMFYSGTTAEAVSGTLVLSWGCVSMYGVPLQLVAFRYTTDPNYHLSIL